MNHYGHCTNSGTVLRVDISLKSTLNNSHSFILDCIKTNHNLLTGTAWDSSDINLETLSGANALHHTYGIYYQTIKETDETETETEEISEIHINLNQSPITINQQSINYNTNQQLQSQ